MNKITNVNKWNSKILKNITLIIKLRVFNISNIKYMIPSLKNSVVVSCLIKLRNCQRPDLTVRVSLGKHGLAQTYNRETFYWVFLTIFEIHQWSEPRRGKGLANNLNFCQVVKDSFLMCYLNHFSFFTSRKFKLWVIINDMTLNTFEEKQK